MVPKLELAREWLPRYTGMAIDDFGDYVLLTNFETYFIRFVSKFNCDVHGAGRPMQAATNADGLSMVNFDQVAQCRDHHGSPGSPKP